MASSAREPLQQFLAATRTTNRYEFDFPGTEMEATRHVQNMRVYLSRARNKFRARGKETKQFKINLVSMTPTAVGGRIATHVVLERSEDSLMNELLEGLEVIGEGKDAS